jgi:hypothetical protein
VPRKAPIDQVDEEKKASQRVNLSERKKVLKIKQ